MQIRGSLSEWAKQNNFFFTVSMNSVADRVISDDMKLEGDMDIFIGQPDIDEIIRRCDTYEERLIALAVLCYAKAYADASGVFKISQRMLSYWTGLNARSVKKYLDRLCGLEYICLEKKGDINSWYQSTVVIQLNTYKALFPITNVGEYCLLDNNIHALYDLVFVGIDRTKEIWYDLPGYNDLYLISNHLRVMVKGREINGRKFKEKVLRPFKSSSGKEYVNLIDESQNQVKVSVEKLSKSVL